MNHQNIPAWTGFNVITEKANENLEANKCEIGYFPIINSPAHDADTLWTVIQRCMKVTEMINPGQTTVITLDEALYSRAKELQWSQPEKCRKLFLRLGNFHIALNFMRAIGHHFTNSGLEDVWTESGVYGENTAQNIISAKSYNRSIRAHKMTYEALWRILWPKFMDWTKQKGVELQNIYEDVQILLQSMESTDGDLEPSEALSSLERTLTDSDLHRLLKEFDDEVSPTSQYWRDYMKMTSLLLQFIRAERIGDWKLHTDTVVKMLPWFAIHDHTNYTRWLSVYIADIKGLPDCHPDVFSEFSNGNFVVSQNKNKFSQISTDQALEHVNKIGKTAGGIIGISRIDSARDRWCLTFNHRARITNETFQMFGLNLDEEDATKTQHKECGSVRIKRDEQDVVLIKHKFLELGVFSREEPQLICLSTNDVAPEPVKTDLLGAYEKGTRKIESFVSSRLIQQDVSFFSKLQLSKIKTMGTLYEVKSTVIPEKNIKADRNLYQRLLIAKDAGREIDLQTVLSHELAARPLSLADTSGLLNKTNKAVLGQILKQITKEQLPSSMEKTCTIIDGPALIQALGKPAKATNFGDLADCFADAVFRNFSNSCTRVDVVFDRYNSVSIKNACRSRRVCSKPIRRIIYNRSVPLPTKWNNFISLSENKADLARFLSEELQNKAKTGLCQNELIVSGGFRDCVHAESNKRNIDTLRANHEEADTRIVLHAHEAKCEGYQRVLVSSQDTDVLVLLTHFASKLSKEIWMCTGTYKQRVYVPVHDILLPDSVRRNLPAYHSITGCDTVSQFSGHGKRTTWETFNKHAELLDHLGVDSLSTQTVKKVEEFVCRIYAPNSMSNSINGIRYKLFQKGKADPRSLPPTEESLRQHIKRAHYQARIWRLATCAQPNIPTPIGNGWILDSNSELQPELSNAEPVPQICLDIVFCKCQSCSSNRCSCKIKHLRCTAACDCSETICHNPLNR